MSTTRLGDALRITAELADRVRVDDDIADFYVHIFQVTVRTSEDVHRFARRAGADVKTWEDRNAWFTYAEADGPIRFAVISVEPIPRELRLPTDTKANER